MVSGSEGTKGDEDMTKLCNHRRKIVAMATLYRSMESHGPLGLSHLGPGDCSLPCFGPPHPSPSFLWHCDPGLVLSTGAHLSKPALSLPLQLNGERAITLLSFFSAIQQAEQISLC